MAEEIKLSKIGELLRGNELLLTQIFGAYCTENNDIAQDFFNFLFVDSRFANTCLSTNLPKADREKRQVGNFFRGKSQKITNLTP